MAIQSVCVCSRESALEFWNTLEAPKCWITICSQRSKPLVTHSTKDILVCKFDDINVNPLTKSQARKIKNFLLNKHLNSPKSWNLLINCRAGISRSTAIARFTEHNLNITNQTFEQQPFPNRAVMQALGVSAEHWYVNL